MWNEIEKKKCSGCLGVQETITEDDFKNAYQNRGGVILRFLRGALLKRNVFWH